MSKKILFFGTPKFAATVLEGLLSNNYEVIGVVTQPDKPVGRKQILTPSPVKEVAIKYNVPVYQPLSLRKDYEFLKDISFDMIVTAAYGQILPQAVLDMPKINSINVHGSLLPNYRGGAPIQRAIMNGDKVTGITIMKMVDKMDAGLMYAKKEVVIESTDTTTSLFDKLAIAGRDLLLETIDDLFENRISGEIQDEEKVTFAWTLKKEEEKIDFNDSCLNVYNKARALLDVPAGYCFLKDKQLKIYQCDFSTLNDSKEAGSLRIENKNHLYVKCNDGYLELLRVKPEGKQEMDVKDFLNGLNKEELIKERLL